MQATTKTPRKRLTCNCCGAETYGRQWPNRDTGYGMCADCLTFVRSRGMSEAEIKDLYGVEGVHCGMCEGKDTEALREILGEALGA